ncbi:hypothetical protein L6164_025038 [Bauhinia variegata]|uniref:Uncharacterized protein n=1 Tax=Bauhinia variegata TaxID=167791 RepID=A0ACB9LZI0_BAUVA|nr:hypothetical protein L6164_025038 [Bauhinia variegata]
MRKRRGWTPQSDMAKDDGVHRSFICVVSSPNRQPRARPPPFSPILRRFLFRFHINREILLGKPLASAFKSASGSFTQHNCKQRIQ